ncbi:hypothetical protein [Nocardioides sp. NPDC127503]|uniref:hypothetical protein n=1 Tax=Nocardioides sp. NPDC127503 TaxID=3154516 RepID=UPI0033245F95
MEEARSTYVYKVLEAAWGIWISITAVARHTDAEGAYRDLLKTTLDFAGTAAELPTEYQDALRAGWARIALDVLRATGRPIRVTIEDVTFVDTDFQIEGLAVAICRWAESVFDINAHEVDVAFDAAANCYRIAWRT